MSTKTSTAALDLFSRATLCTPGRVPRHPAGAAGARDGRASRSAPRRSTGSVNEAPALERSPRSEESLFDVRSKQNFEQARIAVRQEVVMKSTNRKNTRSMRTILPVILRITLSLILWTLGTSMSFLAAEPKEQHLVYSFPVDRAKIEALQRWVNSGHDEWCRGPQLVTVTSLQWILPESGNYELASAPVGNATQTKNDRRVHYPFRRRFNYIPHNPSPLSVAAPTGTFNTQHRLGPGAR